MTTTGGGAVVEGGGGAVVGTDDVAWASICSPLDPMTATSANIPADAMPAVSVRATTAG
jgi:hypothetical protein